jgi:hypothetical protein
VEKAKVTSLDFGPSCSKNFHYTCLSWKLETTTLTMSMNTADHLLDPPTLLEYAGETSFFEGTPPLSQGVGYLVVLGFGAAFSVFTTLIVYANQAFGVTGDVTSEHFKYAHTPNATPSSPLCFPLFALADHMLSSLISTVRLGAWSRPASLRRSSSVSGRGRLRFFKAPTWLGVTAYQGLFGTKGTDFSRWTSHRVCPDNAPIRSFVCVLL